jgi:hypothetical protein
VHECVCVVELESVEVISRTDCVGEMLLCRAVCLYMWPLEALSLWIPVMLTEAREIGKRENSRITWRLRSDGNAQRPRTFVFTSRFKTLGIDPSQGAGMWLVSGSRECWMSPTELRWKSRSSASVPGMGTRDNQISVCFQKDNSIKKYCKTRGVAADNVD